MNVSSPSPAATSKRQADVWSAYAEALRPPPDLSSSEFADAYRVLHPEYCVENPGPWRDSNTKFPYQPDVMNAVDEAIATGKQGVVLMKAGQIGGTECMRNAMLRQKVRYPGPQLYLTSVEKVAEESGRELDLIIRDMPPLARKLTGESKLLIKRFVDGKLVLCGGKSINNLQSTPYRIVGLDEVDSLSQNIAGDGDPVKLAQVRLDSFVGATLMIAWAHPTTREKGAGKLYYEESDQRRGFITHKCGREFWLKWEEVIRVVPREGQTPEQAEKDPDCYELFCPHCKAKIEEPERVAMLRAGVRQKSTLPPEEAAKKSWVGVHASQLYTPHKSIRHFAERWIATDCGRDADAKRVFVNKVLGDVDEPKVKELDLDSLRALIVVKRRNKDPEFYSRGQVPPQVLFLTAGQDSNSKLLHHAVWGWGVRETVDKARLLCGWLIDYGEIKREYSLTFSDAEFHAYDELIYTRRFPCTDGVRSYMVRGCAHDISWENTQIPLIRYCRTWPGRAKPSKGASETATSASHAPYVSEGRAKRFKLGDSEVFDDAQLVLNTYMLKQDFYGWVDQRIEVHDVQDGRVIGARTVPRLALPEDVTDLWLTHTKNEKLTRGKDGEMVYKRTGPNHLADCNTYAYGVALNFDPHAKNLTAEEYGQQRTARASAPRHTGGKGGYGALGRHSDPSMG